MGLKIQDDNPDAKKSKKQIVELFNSLTHAVLQRVVSSYYQYNLSSLPLFVLIFYFYNPRASIFYPFLW
jgi:hypothetical protein